MPKSDSYAKRLDKMYRDLTDEQRSLLHDLMRSFGEAADIAEDRASKFGFSESLFLGCDAVDGGENIKVDNIANTMYDEGGIQEQIAWMMMDKIKHLTEDE